MTSDRDWEDRWTEAVKQLEILSLDSPPAVKETARLAARTLQLAYSVVKAEERGELIYQKENER